MSVSLNSRPSRKSALNWIHYTTCIASVNGLYSRVQVRTSQQYISHEWKATSCVSGCYANAQLLGDEFFDWLSEGNGCRMCIDPLKWHRYADNLLATVAMHHAGGQACICAQDSYKCSTFIYRHTSGLLVSHCIVHHWTQRRGSQISSRYLMALIHMKLRWTVSREKIV